MKSNCFIEAIRAKFKNPSIKITYLPAKINVVRCPHIMWSDGVQDYDFGTNTKLRPLEYVLHNGEIRTFPLGYAEKYKKVMSLRRSRNQIKERLI